MPSQASPSGPMAFPGYRHIFWARAASSAGSYMQVVAATWYVYSLTNSATAVGVLTALALGPALVGGPIGGSLCDRYDPKRLAILLSSLQVIPSALMAVLDVAGVLSVPLLYVLVLAGAIPFSLNQPVISLVVSYAVPEEYRHAAVARASMVFNVTRLLGASVGGLLVDQFGVGAAFAFNAASYAAVALVLRGVTLYLTPGERPQSRAAAKITDGIKDGLALPLLRLVAVGVAVFFTLVAPIEQLMPVVATEHGLNAAAVGILVAAIGVGALLANPFIGNRQRTAAARRRLLGIGLLLAAPGMVLLAVTPQHGIAVDVLGAILIGFGWEFVFVSGQSIIAVDVPSMLRGRMMGLFFVLVTATTALGAIAVGALFQHLGLAVTMLLNAAVVGAGGVVLLLASGRSPELASDDSAATV